MPRWPLWPFLSPSRVATKPGTGVALTEHVVDGDPTVRALVTTPSTVSERRPAVLFLHGGGMVVGSPDFEAFEAGHLARTLDAVVVSPDYRLAPENPFPAALDDCMATLTWMRARADELCIDPDRIAVTGSSAGGGLSAAVAQRATDEEIPLRPGSRLPDDRRPHRPARRSRRPWPVHVDAGVEPLGLDRVSRSRTSVVRSARLCGTGAPHRPDRPAACVGRRRRPRCERSVAAWQITCGPICERGLAQLLLRLT